MPAAEAKRRDSGDLQPSEKSQTRSGHKGLSRRHNTQPYDVESQSPNTQAAPFPGATYGFHPADQPAQPPRRVTSIGSLHKQRSNASLHTDPVITPGDPGTTPNHENHPDESLAEELAWNPSHPCFPHPNPHVPLASPAYENTRIIRIKRDWMAHGDMAPAYSNIYPEILDPLLPESEFRFLINHVNRSLIEAFDPFSAWNWFDGLLGLATGWFWEDFRPAGMKGKLRALEFWIEQWNQRVGSRDGVRVIPLRRTGYMNLDIEIPDPQVRVVDPNAPVDEDEDDHGDIDGIHSHNNANMNMRVGELRYGVATTTNTDTESRV